jgi:hypothetical protein
LGRVKEIKAVSSALRSTAITPLIVKSKTVDKFSYLLNKQKDTTMKRKTAGLLLLLGLITPLVGCEGGDGGEQTEEQEQVAPGAEEAETENTEGGEGGEGGEGD